MAKLSIVIPVYKGAPYIRNCLENIKKQTFQDWEAIFVNDGSPDASGELLDKYVAGADKCRVIHQENGGTAKARNTGMDAASGEYIAFLDVDDELDPRMYEILVRLMDSMGADMGICGYYFKVDREINGRKRTVYLEEKNYPTCFLKDRKAIRERLIDLWDKDMLSTVWNRLYRMDLIKEKNLRYREGHVYTEDRVYNRQFVENCSSIAVTDQCLYYFIRERAGSVTERYWDNYFTIRHKEYVEFQAHFKKMGMWNPDSREYVSREFVERIAACLENIFHADNTVSRRKKRKKIAWIISHPDVRKALRYARCRSLKMRIFLLPVRMRWTGGTYFIGWFAYRVRHQFPALFYALRSRR